MEFQNFEDIRPYNNNEVEEKMKLLLADPVFDRVLLHIYPDEQKIREVKYLLSTFKTIDDIQFKFIYELLKMVIATTTDGLTADGLEHLEKDKPYLFISNHRDIILDSALLNYHIYKNGMNTTQIAIGSNLLILDWIIHAVKLNRTFIINRDATSRELLAASQKVSEYIRYSITNENISIWIAQREGRTKDGSDMTQISLLKMLNMSNKKSFIEGFSELNVVPVSISYEIEPCGIGKIRELMKKEVDTGYVKRSKDDLKSMARGMFGKKGHIHFSFGKPLNTELAGYNEKERPNELFQQLAGSIDDHIHKQFKLWPNNFVAYDLLNDSNIYFDKYSEENKKTFEKLITQAQAEIEGNKEDIRNRFLKMYANPVINANA
ncbi:MAG: 1-acyl-sn-glycerol-3-phosphate acyltransferase [Prolixibacteraceae bacterium]|nr:1-acyl-sn-glycerol-3-phosphate acyltransferase [Prolixibacteraceae bacterium]MBN2774460.1 1-acyl-sn-glycerol-3-phosphate acyltransferase [Prolixibacteraceae bacterium]